jgi:hypothetical protein
MNIHKLFYNCVRTISLLSILGILSVGFILPISVMQSLLINPIILVSLMIIFVIAHEKLQPVRQLTNIVNFPENLKPKRGAVNKVA